MNLGEITKSMQELNNWALESSTIVKEYELENFSQAIDFVNKIKEIAEKHNHHPDITIQYNVVFLVLTTHSAGGLTEKDFEVAKEIDKISFK